MKKSLLIFILIMNFNTIIYAQNNYYYYLNNAKVYLELDKTKLNISTFENFQKPTISNLNFKDFNLSDGNVNNQNLKFAKLEFQNLPTEIEFLQKSNSLKTNAEIKNVCYYYRKPSFPSIGTSNVFYVKLKNASDYTILQQIAIQKNVQIVSQIPNMPLWYRLSLNKTTIGDALKLSNYFYETGLFANVDPAFMFDFKGEIPSEDVTQIQNPISTCVNDPFYAYQWGLVNPFPHPNINTCPAWNYSLGANVKIAIVDDGIRSTSQDLLGKIINSCDTTNNGVPTNNIVGGHGTGVAVVTAAISNDNYGIAGVAPQAKLIDVYWNSVLPDMTINPHTTEQTASGIEWAWQQGADIINNSWGNLEESGVESTVMNEAIDNALNFGRNGKGALVVFSSGNYSNNITYPARYTPRITTVGAINHLGERWDTTPNPNPTPNWQSSYGPNLDLMAPGANIAVGEGFGGGIAYFTGTSYAHHTLVV